MDNGEQRKRLLGWLVIPAALLAAFNAITSNLTHEWFWFALDCVGFVAFSYVALWNFGIVKYTVKVGRRR